MAAHPLRERLVAALMRPGRGRPRHRGAARVRAHEGGPGRRAGRRPLAGAVRAARRAAARRAGDAREENRKTNLRAELTSFVGRDADVAVVRELVAEHRLTTLIGPGGSGKTRLATETARTLLGDLPDGVWLVELAAIGADG